MDEIETVHSRVMELIASSLDNFDVEDFVHPEFNGIAAHRIVSDLEFHHFKIIKLEPQPLRPQERK